MVVMLRKMPRTSLPPAGCVPATAERNVLWVDLSDRQWRPLVETYLRQGIRGRSNDLGRPSVCVGVSGVLL